MSDVGDIALRPSGSSVPFGRQEIVLFPSPKRITAQLNSKTFADSRDVIVLHEKGYRPVWYFPRADVDMALLSPYAQTSHCPRKGDAAYYGEKSSTEDAGPIAWSYEDPLRNIEEIRDRIAFYFDRIDDWREDGEIVRGSVPDPFVRIDVRSVSDVVEVLVGGELIAKSIAAKMLYETGLTSRIYIPPKDVKTRYLIRSDTATYCIYKGAASYAHVEVGNDPIKDAAWRYRDPKPESVQIKDHWCFWLEKVDEIRIGGRLVAKPETVPKHYNKSSETTPI